jgi:hypothetical protein
LPLVRCGGARSNAFVHIIAAITAYQINPFKPKLNLQPRYQLETTA